VLLGQGVDGSNGLHGRLGHVVLLRSDITPEALVFASQVGKDPPMSSSALSAAAAS
jgi:hypothetical protein